MTGMYFDGRPHTFFLVWGPPLKYIQDYPRYLYTFTSQSGIPNRQLNVSGGDEAVAISNGNNAILMKMWWWNALVRDYVTPLYWQQLEYNPGYNRRQTSRKRWEYTGWIYSIINDSMRVCYCIFVSASFMWGEFQIQFYSITVPHFFHVTRYWALMRIHYFELIIAVKGN